MNTKYISSCGLLRTRENSDVFNSLDQIYSVFTSKKQISSMYLPTCYITSKLIVFDHGRRTVEEVQVVFKCFNWFRVTIIINAFNEKKPTINLL